MLIIRDDLARVFNLMNDDVLTGRKVSPFPLQHKLYRVVWGGAWLLLFRFSPRPLRRWRRFLLELFGASIDRSANIYPGVRVWAPWRLKVGAHTGIADGVFLYSQDWIIIGARTVISQGCYVCTGTHDYTQVGMPLVTKVVTIGDDVWLAANTFVHPGVKVGRGAVIGACSVITKDVPEWMVCVGNPCVPIKQRIMKPLA